MYWVAHLVYLVSMFIPGRLVDDRIILSLLGLRFIDIEMNFMPYSPCDPVLFDVSRSGRACPWWFFSLDALCIFRGVTCLCRAHGGFSVLFASLSIAGNCRVVAIAYTTSLTTSQGQIPAIDKLRNHREPTIRFGATARARHNARKIPQRIRWRKTTMGQHAAPTRRAGETSNKTGSAWRNTTTPRSGT